MGDSLDTRVDRANRMLREGQVTTRYLASIKAVEAEGITHPPDVARISKEIRSELSRKANEAKKAKKKRERENRDAEFAKLHRSTNEDVYPID